MRSSSALLALAALSVGEVFAGPAHAHHHRAKHAKKGLEAVNWNDIDWDKVGVNWDKINYPGDAKPDAPVVVASSLSTSSIASIASVIPVSSTTPSKADAVSTTAVESAPSKVTSVSSASASASPSTSPNPGAYTGLFENLWEGLEGCSNQRKSFGGRTNSFGDYVSYVANYGSPYGSNVMFVDDPEKYDYTITFVNTASEEMTVNLWNKVGADLQPNSGATSAPKSTTLTFNLSPGQSATVAIDEDSTLAFCEAVSRFEKSSGAFAQTFGEIKMKKNDSGYNVSKILNTGKDYKMTMSAKETSCVSSETQNNWITETQTTGSGSCYVPADTVHLKVEMGGCE